VRETCRYWISLMADGMQSFLDPVQSSTTTWHDEIRLPATVEDYNEYCYHVAGTVGGLGTELVIAHYHLEGLVAEKLLDGSKICGRALQKTNILKDFTEDLERRICYLPDEWLGEIGYSPLQLAGAAQDWCYSVVQDVLDELRDATEYVCNIPVEAMGYRIASLVCLLPAYQTMVLAASRQAQLFTKEHQIKIDRVTMAQCLHDAATMAPDNHAIADHCQRLEQTICTEFLAEPVHT
jgi:farnesyl-diphosphate farnesyltransferase